MVSDRPFYSANEMRIDLMLQEFDVQRCYPKAKVWRGNGCLFVDMTVKDPTFRHIYRIEAFYRPNQSPLVYILEPVIRPRAAIHMYPDGHLCLYDPSHIGYRKRFSIAQEILPLTFKWIFYYDVWLFNGNHWLGPETAHGSRVTVEELEYWERRRVA